MAGVNLSFRRSSSQRSSWGRKSRAPRRLSPANACVDTSTCTSRTYASKFLFAEQGEQHRSCLAVVVRFRPRPGRDDLGAARGEHLAQRQTEPAARPGKDQHLVAGRRAEHLLHHDDFAVVPQPRAHPDTYSSSSHMSSSTRPRPREPKDLLDLLLVRCGFVLGLLDGAGKSRPPAPTTVAGPWRSTWRSDNGSVRSVTKCWHHNSRSTAARHPPVRVTGEGMKRLAQRRPVQICRPDLREQVLVEVSLAAIAREEAQVRQFSFGRLGPHLEIPAARQNDLAGPAEREVHLRAGEPVPRFDVHSFSRITRKSGTWRRRRPSTVVDSKNGWAKTPVTTWSKSA